MKTTEIYRKTAKAVSSFAAIVALAGAMMVPQLHAAPPTDAELSAINAQLVSDLGAFLTSGKETNIFTASTSQIKDAVLAVYAANPGLTTATDLIEAVGGARGNAVASVLDALLVAHAVSADIAELTNSAAVAAPLYAANIVKEGLEQAEASNVASEAVDIADLVAASTPSQAGNVAKKFLQTVDSGVNITTTDAVNGIVTIFNTPALTADVVAGVAKKAGQGSAAFAPGAVALLANAVKSNVPSSVSLIGLLGFADGAWDATNAGSEETQIIALNPSLSAEITLFYDNRAAGTSVSTDAATLTTAIGSNPTKRVSLTLAAVLADSGGGAGSLTFAGATGSSPSDAISIAQLTTLARPKVAEKIAQGTARGLGSSATVDDIAGAVAGASPFYAGKVVKKLNTDSSLALSTVEKDAVAQAVFTAAPQEAGRIGYWGIGKSFKASASDDPAALSQYAGVEALASTDAETAALTAGVVAARKTLQSGSGVSLISGTASNAAAAERGGETAVALVGDKKLDNKPGKALLNAVEIADDTSAKYDRALAAIASLEALGASDFISVFAAGVSISGTYADDVYTAARAQLALKDFSGNPSANLKKIDAANDTITDVIALGATPANGLVYTTVLNRARMFANKTLAAAITTGAVYGNWIRAGEVAKAAAKGQPSQASKVASAALRAANLSFREEKGQLVWTGSPTGVAYYHGVTSGSGGESNDAANGFAVDSDQAVSAASIVASAVDGVTEGIVYNNATKEFSDEKKAIVGVVKAATTEALNEHKSVKTATESTKSGDERQQVRGVAGGTFIGLDTANVTGDFVTLLGDIAAAATKAAKLYALDIAYTLGEVLGARGHATLAKFTEITGKIFTAGGGIRTATAIIDAYNNGVSYGSANTATVGTIAWLAFNKNPSNLPVTDISGAAGL